MIAGAPGARQARPGARIAAGRQRPACRARASQGCWPTASAPGRRSPPGPRRAPVTILFALQRAGPVEAPCPAAVLPHSRRQRHRNRLVVTRCSPPSCSAFVGGMGNLLGSLRLSRERPRRAASAGSSSSVRWSGSSSRPGCGPGRAAQATSPSPPSAAPCWAAPGSVPVADRLTAAIAAFLPRAPRPGRAGLNTSATCSRAAARNRRAPGVARSSASSTSAGAWRGDRPAGRERGAREHRRPRAVRRHRRALPGRRGAALLGAPARQALPGGAGPRVSAG